METLDSVLANLVLRMKEIVIFILTVRVISNVDQTIVLTPMVLIQIQIVAMPLLSELKIFAGLVYHAMQMKVTVILMMNVVVICFVDQTIVLIL